VTGTKPLQVQASYRQARAVCRNTRSGGEQSIPSNARSRGIARQRGSRYGRRRLAEKPGSWERDSDHHPGRGRLARTSGASGVRRDL